MLSAEERAVVNIPAKDRTPAQKKLAAGLETSLRITWEEVAAAVAANPADHARREQLKREIYEIERTLPRPPAQAMALVDEKSKVTDTFVLRRGDYKNARAEGCPPTAGRDPDVASGRIVSGRRSRARGPRPAARRRWRDGSPARTIRFPARVIVNRLWQYSFRPWDRGDRERLRRARRATVAPRAARLAGLRSWSPAAGGSSRSIA